MSGPAGQEAASFAAAAEKRALDLDALRATLVDAIGVHLGVADVAVDALRVPEGVGTSSGTVLFTAGWTADGSRVTRDLVARTCPDKVQLFRDPDFHKQFAVIDALHRSGRVKVPEALFYEADAGRIGVPFFVMEQLRGQVPISMPGYNVGGFLFDASPAQRRVAWASAMEELGRIARVPVDELGFLDPPAPGPTPLEQQLAYWRGSIDWSTGGETPDAVWAVYEWLAANLPAERPAGFTWGDARIGNMMFGPDFRLVGVMDWEQANLSGIRQDLGWWLFFDDFHSTARGIARLDGLGTRTETIAFWEDRVGEPAGDLRWYEVFTGLQVTLLSIRTLKILESPDALDLDRNLGYAVTRDRLGW